MGVFGESLCVAAWGEVPGHSQPVFVVAAWWSGADAAPEASGVDDGVVEAAQQRGVVRVGAASVDPVIRWCAPHPTKCPRFAAELRGDPEKSD